MCDAQNVVLEESKSIKITTSGIQNETAWNTYTLGNETCHLTQSATTNITTVWNKEESGFHFDRIILCFMCRETPYEKFYYINR